MVWACVKDEPKQTHENNFRNRKRKERRNQERPGIKNKPNWGKVREIIKEMKEEDKYYCFNSFPIKRTQTIGEIYRNQSLCICKISGCI